MGHLLYEKTMGSGQSCVAGRDVCGKPPSGYGNWPNWRNRS
jgi:hypothetical protein